MSPIILLSSSFTSFSPLFYPCESHFFISLGNVTSENCSGIKVAGCPRKKYITSTVVQSKSVHHATIQFSKEQFSAIRLGAMESNTYNSHNYYMQLFNFGQRSAIRVILCSAGEDDWDPPWQHELLMVPL